MLKKKFPQSREDRKLAQYLRIISQMEEKEQRKRKQDLPKPVRRSSKAVKEVAVAPAPAHAPPPQQQQQQKEASSDEELELYPQVLEKKVVHFDWKRRLLRSAMEGESNCGEAVVMATGPSPPLNEKKEIDGLVMELINSPAAAATATGGGGSKNGSKRPAPDDSDEEEEPAKKGKKKPKPTTTSTGGGTGFTRTLTLSPVLARVMGTERMARHEVVKQMWKIIKEKNLYDPKNKQFAVCNEELLAVFGVKRFRTFGMMKYLKNHFRD